jgi:hypothetical protein
MKHIDSDLQKHSELCGKEDNIFNPQVIGGLSLNSFMSNDSCFRLTVDSDVHLFSINKRQLVIQLGFFQKKSSLLAVNKFSVKSEVSKSSFSKFVGFIES